MAELWFKVAVDVLQSPKVLRLRRECGELALLVYLQILAINRIRSCDGVVTESAVHPLTLGQLLGYPEDEMQAALDGLVRHALIERVDGAVTVTGWSDEWRGPLTEAERSRRYRERSRGDE